jgi:hypothetical protein
VIHRGAVTVAVNFSTSPHILDTGGAAVLAALGDVTTNENELAVVIGGESAVVMQR